jgi:carboxymuconolactone decarboxylase family protein
MARIRWVEESEATGKAREVFEAWRRANPNRTNFPEIIHCFSHRPDFMQHVIDFSNELHFSDGHLTRRLKEMIATYVSALNRCPY